MEFIKAIKASRELDFPGMRPGMRRCNTSEPSGSPGPRGASPYTFSTPPSLPQLPASAIRLAAPLPSPATTVPSPPPTPGRGQCRHPCPAPATSSRPLPIPGGANCTFPIGPMHPPTRISPGPKVFTPIRLKWADFPHFSYESPAIRRCSPSPNSCTRP